MRIAHFVQRYPPALGGSEAYFARLSRYLADAGHEVTVFTTNAIDLEAFWRPGACLQAGVCREDGIEVRRYAPRYWPGRRYLLKALSLVPWRTVQCLTLPVNPICPAMWRDAARPKPRYDVVHATAFPYAFPIACGLRLARKQGIPFLVTPFLHLGDPDDPADRTRRRYLTPALLHLLRSADRVLVQTEMEKDALLQEGLVADRVIRIGLGVEPSECCGGDRQRARLAWDAAEEVVVGHLANLSQEKGTVDLLQAAQRCWEHGLRFQLVLAGPQMKNFRRFWTGFSAQANVRLRGVLDEEQKRDFFAGIDLFALPSRSDSFGLVLLEAWVNGVPNLAYRAGGPAEVIHHEDDGLLVKCGDLAGLADALAVLVNDEERRRRLGEAGRQRTASEFRWSDKLAQVSDQYRQACRSCPSQK
jgi:glycosyltransferase involved in cell wall biosynthesis